MAGNLATLRTADGKPVLRFERRLAHPPHKVWRAVTDPDELAHWFPAAVEPAESGLRAGASLRFRFEGADAAGAAQFEEGEVLEFDPQKVFAFRWSDSVLRFELVPDGSGCRLLFSHILGGEDTWGDRLSAARHAAGWDGCLAVLDARLDGAQPPSMDGPWWFESAERYVELFGLADGELRDADGGHLVRFERDLMQPPDQVWTTLTEHEQPVAVGTEPPLQATNEYVPAGTVTEFDAPRVVAYEWLHDGEPAGVVRFELRDQQPLGTRLVLTQTVPSRLAEQEATALAAWHTHLELFFAALHGDVRCPWPAERTEQLRKRYASRLR